MIKFLVQRTDMCQVCVCDKNIATERRQTFENFITSNKKVYILRDEQLTTATRKHLDFAFAFVTWTRFEY